MLLISFIEKTKTNDIQDEYGGRKFSDILPREEIICEVYVSAVLF